MKRPRNEKKYENNSKVTRNCTICFDPMLSEGAHRIVALKCGHLFGKDCILKWLQLKNKCPKCNTVHRRPFSVIDIYTHEFEVMDNSSLKSMEKLLNKERCRRIDAELIISSLKAENEMLKNAITRYSKDVRPMRYLGKSSNSSSLTVEASKLSSEPFRIRKPLNNSHDNLVNSKKSAFYSSSKITKEKSEILPAEAKSSVVSPAPPQPTTKIGTGQRHDEVTLHRRILPTKYQTNNMKQTYTIGTESLSTNVIPSRGVSVLSPVSEASEGGGAVKLHREEQQERGLSETICSNDSSNLKFQKVGEVDITNGRVAELVHYSTSNEMMAKELIINESSTSMHPSDFPEQISMIDLETHRRRCSVKVHSKQIRDLSWNVDYRILLTASFDKTAKLVSMNDDSSTSQIISVSHPIWSCSWDKRRSYEALLGLSNGHVHVYDTRCIREKPLQTHTTWSSSPSPVHSICSLAFSHDEYVYDTGGTNTCSYHNIVSSFNTTAIIRQHNNNNSNTSSNTKGSNTIKFHITSPRLHSNVDTASTSHLTDMNFTSVSCHSTAPFLLGASRRRIGHHHPHQSQLVLFQRNNSAWNNIDLNFSSKVYYEGFNSKCVMSRSLITTFNSSNIYFVAGVVETEKKIRIWNLLDGTIYQDINPPNIDYVRDIKTSDTLMASISSKRVDLFRLKK